MYIRDNILYSQRNDLATDDLELACIEVKLPYNKSFLVATWYRLPSSQIDLFDEWALFLSKCDTENKELIIVGNFNCDLSKALPDSHTQRLKFLCSLYQLKQFINELTRVTSTSATLIDLILTNTRENILQSGVIHLGISDHSLVYALRKFSLPKSFPKYKDVRNFKNFNENQFIVDVMLMPWELVYQHNDPNLCWQVWKDLFPQALDRHAPIQRRRLKSNPIPLLTPEIKKLMQVRDWPKKHAIKHNSSAHWELYKKLCNKVNSELRSQKSNYFIGKIKERSQSNDMKGSWSLINCLLGRNKKMTNVTELIVDDVSIFDDRSIAESMNEYFISIDTKLADEIDSNSDYQNDDLTYANEFLESDSSSTNLFHFRTISVTSVALRLSKLLASKSTGMDTIPAKVLKITANIIAPSLTYIFNISLQSGIYVDDWKLAKIIPIYKSEDRKKCENYRPISILPVISKVFESEIFSQLYEHLNENTLLSDRQCGFRPKYGSNAALLEMCDLWLSHIDKGVVFLHIRKAFDSINHKILLKKLKNQFGICDNELKWFSSYLNDRMQVCYVNGQTSAPKIIVNGIPQAQF